MQNIWKDFLKRKELAVLIVVVSAMIFNSLGMHAGTIQAFVKNEFVSNYKEFINKIFGENSCHEDLETFITEIKSKLKTEINRRDARLVRLNKRRSELANLQAWLTLRLQDLSLMCQSISFCSDKKYQTLK